MTRLVRAWGGLDPHQRLAAIAAAALLVTMFLPWYELQSLDRKTGAINSHSISAFGDVSFVEAAIFLVAVATLALLFARAERRDFHMPGSDGTVVAIAGGWAALLIFYRVFSRPAGHGYPVGIQWGFFLAFVSAGGLAYAGWRMRAAAAPEPPLLRERHRRRPSSDAGQDAGEDVTVVAAAPAREQRAAPVPVRPSPATAQPAPAPAHPAPAPARPTDPPVRPASVAARPAPKRPRYPPAPGGKQLSFEDPDQQRD